MRKNLDLSGGLILAEAVMLTLGAKLGRQHAHDVVYDAAQAAFVENKVFGDLLSADPRVTECLDVKGIAKLMDPTEYCGLSAMLAREAVQRVRERRTP
jgi:adenylosuccinate lyase